MADAKPLAFRPVISGILFAYVTDTKALKTHLNPSGYFLLDGEQVAGNAHLFSAEGQSESLAYKIIHAQVSDEEVYRYKVCIEQCAAHTADIKIVGKDYAELASENDTVMITDGPFVGQTGVIKQVKSHGVKDRCLFYSLGGFCVQLSGVRRYGVIVVSESAKGERAQLPNTWRYIDFLQGRLQSAFFADTSSSALRHILETYNKVRDVERCQAFLLDEAKTLRTESESREVALQAVWLQQIDNEELGALKSLARFFQSADNSVSLGLAELIPDMPLRPFLTPTSGIQLPKGCNYVLFPHNGFVELIFRVNLKQEFQKAEHYPSPSIADSKEGRYAADGKLRGRMRKARPFQLSDREYVYYAHVGLWDDGACGVRALVNWGEFAHRYLALDDEGRKAFLEDLSAKGYVETHRLLSSTPMRDDTPVQSGFVCHLPGVTLQDLMSRYEASLKTKHLPLSLVRTFQPVACLIRSCVPAAVEFWQRQRLLEWRHLIQRFVLLHNLPLSGGGMA